MDAVSAPRRRVFLDLPFDDLDARQAAACILRRPALAPFAYVVTPNADHLARLRRDPALLPLYEAAFLCLLDSRLLANVADALRVTRPALATGADLTAALLPALAGETVTVIGMDEAEFQSLKRRFPGIAWRHHAPPMRLGANPAAFAAAVDFATAAPARCTFIALGSPLQERLAAAIAAQPRATGIGLCIGAALGFAAGKGRAPAWMQRAGMEWLHRLGRDPRRLAGRYLLDDPPILAALLKAALRRSSPRSR